MIVQECGGSSCADVVRIRAVPVNSAFRDRIRASMVSTPAATTPDASSTLSPSRARLLPLLSVLALGLALRLVALQQAANLSRLPGDEEYYVRTGQTIAATGYHPGSYRGPGYPFLLALVFRLAGPNSLQAVRLAQIALALFSIALVFHLVRKGHGQRAALWSALAMAIAPNLVHFTLFLWSETLFIALLLVGLWLLLRFDERGSRRTLALAGLTFAFAALTRESILPFMAILAAWVAFRPAPAAERVRRAAVFVACFLLPILPWTVRNYAVNGSFVLISNCRWYPVAEGNDEYPHVHQGLQWIQSQRMSETQAEAFWRQQALTNIARQQPAWFFRKIASNVPALLTPRTQLVRFVENRWYPQYAPFRRRLLLSIEIVGHLLALFLAALALCLVRADRLKPVVLLYVAYTFVLHVVANADPRFLLPLLPLAFLYVGPLLAGGTALLRSRGRRVAGLAIALVTVGLSLTRIGTVRAAWDLPPNVVLISVDTLRADHLGAYGYARPTSPYLDRLATEGTLFEHAISPTAWTLPAHASMLSGVLPKRHGALRGDSRIAADVPWLPEALHQAGYVTNAVVNAPFLEEEFGFARGFDRYEYVPKAQWQRHQATAMAALTAQGSDRPFFLFVHYMGVHTPYHPPRRFNVFVRPYTGRLTGSQEEVRDFVDGRLQIDDRDRDFLVDLYDGAILAVDARIHDLLLQLHDMRVDENTIVIVTADHGEEFLEHGSLWHSKTLFEELIHVPLIVRGPGIPDARRDACLATLMDIAPTVLDLTGTPRNESDGISLAGVWNGGACPTREVELYTSYNDGRSAKHGLRTAGEKLVVDLDKAKKSFFDLLRDPAERIDRYPDPAASRLERLLPALAPERTAPGPGPRLNPATREQLRALGYYATSDASVKSTNRVRA
jgi:arylsulfatase A-like enzyme